jgi:hypothetical protein
MTEFTRDTSSKTKAIETEYKGYRFRSRLEARWAVFFDAMGYIWEYEPEGFVSTDWGSPIRYLPDFYLSASKTWVEVKGSDESLKEDAQRLECILDFDSPLPGMCNSYDDKNHTKGLLILGNIPEPRHGYIYHPIIQHHEGLVWSWCHFLPNDVAVVTNRKFIEYFPEEWSTQYYFKETKKTMVTNILVAAYKKARQSRFEHGEHP